MSFVTTYPEALTYAAGKLQTLGAALSDQSTAAALPTTGVAPAGADEVSALQAAAFAAYGNLYQSVSAQAAAIHELFVKTLGTSAGSYAMTESANSIAASSPLSALTGTTNTTSAGLIPSGLSGGLANIINVGAGNYSSAASDLLGLAGGGLLTSEESGLGTAPGAQVGLAGSSHPYPTGSGGVPIAAGLGQAASVGRLSVPPSWAAGPATPALSPGAATLAGWTPPPTHGTSVTTVPAGVPSAAAAGRGGGLGAPRYGVKPTVMGRPAGV